MTATNWFLRTLVLKSALSSRMLPDTWLPTWTLTTALQLPVADTTDSMSPRVSGVVWYSIFLDLV